jgi:CRISPR-associated endonuclease/helicase Cas3
MAEARRSIEEVRGWLARALDVPSAFPWQLALLDRMLAGELPNVVDVPTGLGKTAVIAIWMVARAAGADVPRRLVYVVDRRAVVDQATDVAETLRNFVEQEPELKSVLELEPNRPLPISTLRGQFLDNREWLADPSTPAIVLGTVDMVGSRLLFEGYGVSRKMRPYHAGLLGADSLVVLDESHLVPPFQHLIRTISRATDTGLGPREPARAELVPRLRLLSLSATGRAEPNTLTLSRADRDHPVVARRLGATKALELRTEVAERDLPERLAEEAWTLTTSDTKPARCIVFCNRRVDAQAVADQLAKRAGKTTPVDIELFVGARRVHERTVAAEWLRTRGFLAGRAVALDKPAFVIATSAGEVGVDLDADHMVSDLVAWERMVQRLGRVNRRGDGAATVVVIPSTVDVDDEELAVRLAAASEVLRELPRTKGDVFDASPGALTTLKERAMTDERLREIITRATTSEPLRPALTRPLVEAWSMTSLEEHTGRPEVGPWLRGWIREEEPQTTIVWREILPIIRDTRGSRPLPGFDLEVFLAAAGPQLAEQLETETWRAMEWLTARLSTLVDSKTTVAPALPDQQSPAAEADAEGEPAAALNDSPGPRPLRSNEVVGVIVSGSKDPWAFSALDLSTKEKRAELEARLRGATLLVDVRIGGLEKGLLHDERDTAEDVTTLRRHDGEPVLPIRVRRMRDDERGDAAEGVASPEAWRQEARIAIGHSKTGEEEEWLVAESLGSAPAESEEGRAIGAKRAQKLEEHEAWAEKAARGIAERLGLPRPYADVLALAARLHDEGKKARRWQRAFRAPPDGVYAKTRSRPNIHLLAGYRHELGSLPHAERDGRVQALDDDLRDLCLHLIAAHHGNARPLIRTDGAEEPPSKLEARAQEIALRFARLEKRWGPWGLAWWEALLRAADQQASRQNDEGGAGG